MEIAAKNNGEGVQVPYVKDGLSFWIDAIWNVGIGRHEDNVIPYDLMRRGTYKSGSCAFGKDFILIEMGQQPLVYKLDDVVRMFPTNTAGCGTLEVVFEATLGYGSDLYQGDVWLGEGFAYANTQAHYIQAYKNSAGIRRYPITLAAGTYKYSSSVFFNNDIVDSINVNGQNQSLQDNISTPNKDLSPFVKIGGSTTSCTNRKFYCVRLYDRQLTEEETTSNWLVDKERFGI